MRVILEMVLVDRAADVLRFDARLVTSHGTTPFGGGALTLPAQAFDEPPAIGASIVVELIELAAHALGEE